MNNRTLYVLLLATIAGIMSAVLTHKLVTADKVEVLVPLHDLEPRQSLREARIFAKRYFPREQITRPDPVTDHEQIKDRFAKNLVLKKDQPLYLDDTAVADAAGAPPTGATGTPAHALSNRPLLPDGHVGISFSAEGNISENVRVGDPYDLVLYRPVEEDGDVEIKQFPLMAGVRVVAVHRHRPSGAPADGPGQVNAVTFAIRLADALKLLQVMNQPQCKVAPVAQRAAQPKAAPPAPTSPTPTKPTPTVPSAPEPPGAGAPGR
jgi:hypothetical protein